MQASLFLMAGWAGLALIFGSGLLVLGRLRAGPPWRLGFALAAGPVVGLALWLLGTNALRPYCWNLPQAAWGALLGLLLLLGGPRPAWSRPGLSRPGSAFLLIGGLLVFLFTNSWQLNRPDYDFWTDFPQQGLLLQGQFPPANPFFADLEMRGHYGKNLLVASVSALTGASLVTTAHWTVCYLQVSSLWILWLGLLELGIRPSAASWATTLTFLGVAAGGWAGLLDHFYHHHALAQPLLLLASVLLLRLRSHASPGLAVLTGALLGLLAIVFEVYSGLLGLSAIATWPRRRRAVPTLALALGVAALIALTQGGVFSDLARRGLQPQGEPGEGLANQAQLVRVQFPKYRLGELYLQPWDYWRLSCAYQYTPFSPGKTRYDGRRLYRPIWSWQVIRIHWLALYLAPLAIWLNRRRWMARFWAWFAGLAYVIPALVDFGPIYEAEYYRWEYASSLGLALVLGLALERIYRVAPRRWPAHRTWVQGLCLSLAALTCLPGLARLGSRLTALDVRYVSTWFAPPLGDAWLWRNRDRLHLSECDLPAISALAERALPGDLMFTDRSRATDAEPFGLILESVWVGLTGVRSVGHALTLPGEYVGTPPFRRTAQARLFIEHPGPAALAGLGVDWLALSPELADRLGPCPGVEAVWLGSDCRLLRVTRGRVEPKREAPVGAVTITPQQERVSNATVTVLPIQVTNHSGRKGLATWARVQFQSPSGQPVESFQTDLEPRTLPAGESVSLGLPLATPFEIGPYQVVVELAGARSVFPLQVRPARTATPTPGAQGP